MRIQYNRLNFYTPWISFLLFIMIMTTVVIAQAQKTLSLTEAINQAIEENPNLASAEANLEASRENIKIAQGNYLPGVNLVGSLSQSKTATFSETAGVIPASSAIVGASLSQMIFNEKYLANHKIQKYLYASQEEQYRVSRYTIISAAGQAYIALLFADDLLDVQQENMLITEQNLQASRDRQEVGSTNLQEVLRWETQLFSNHQAVESQKASVIVSRGGLNQILNVPLETRNEPEKLTISKNGFIFSSNVVADAVNDERKAQIIRDYLVELGLANSPALASNDQQLLAQERQVKSNKRWAIPQLNASAGADAKFAFDEEGADEIGDDFGFWKVGLTMYWPLVKGGANISKVKQSKFQMSALELQRYNLMTSIEQSIRASTAVVMGDFKNIGFAQSQSETAQRNFDLVNDSYLVGESSLLNLLDAQTQKLGADISSRVALYTFFIDLLTLEQAIGYFPFMQPKDEADKIVGELESRLLQVQ